MVTIFKYIKETFSRLELPSSVWANSQFATFMNRNPSFNARFCHYRNFSHLIHDTIAFVLTTPKSAPILLPTTMANTSSNEKPDQARDLSTSKRIELSYPLVDDEGNALGPHREIGPKLWQCSRDPTQPLMRLR